ncbi:MAG TPA: MAC/perforin domain-containing protein [Ktedonosporobacter sp.]|nr:MAC/perforin domain-containing protein [Ktedonosporobacter sp.]
MSVRNTLRQLSTLQAPTLDDANFVGQGFNIFGTYDANSFIKPLFNYADAPTHPITIDNIVYQVPVYVIHLPGGKTDYKSESGVSREEFQNSIATTAGVSASYGAFSGHMEASFSHQVTQSSEYMYAHNTMYTWDGSLELVPDTKYLIGYFTEAVNHLPSVVTPENLHIFTDFFATYGVYYTRQVRMGASLEFYVAVSTTSSDDAQQVKVMLEAHYNGLFTKGSVSSSLEHTQEWKSYISTSVVSMTLTGGTTDTRAKLAGINLKEPSQDTVNAYNAWVETISANLDPVNFQLAPIWNLCGEKSAVVHQAWEQFSSVMHPAMYIETTSPQSRPMVVSLTGKGDIVPTTPPQYPLGCMAAILDRNDLLGPNSVKFSRYYSINPDNWSATFQDMYNQVANDIRKSGFDNQNHVLVFATMGASVNCVPIENLYGLLISAGAGKQLSTWVSNATAPGKPGGPNVCYILVGVLNQGQGKGFETFDMVPANQSVLSTLNLFFYRPSVSGGLYTMGLNPFPTTATESSQEEVEARKHQ